MVLFLYKKVCQDGFFELQANEQGCEFVNELSEELHKEDPSTSKCFSKHQNQSIKYTLVKMLEYAAHE